MAETNNPPNSDSTYTPPPPEAPKLYQVAILFVYHILLALFLAYAIYNAWPPQPWPGDKAKAANSNANSQTGGNSSAANEGGANMNARSRAAANTGTNTNAASANSSNSASAGNVNASGASSNNSATNVNATSAGGTAGANTGNTNTAGGANANNGTATNGTSYTESKEELPPPFVILWWRFQPTLEVRLLLIVLLAGAIGSYVHATSSFVDYLGNRTIISSWVWWYLLRPFIGMMLALIFYFVFRGGFITAGVNPSGEDAARFINPFGIAALAGLVGMFAKVAADKLNEVFTTLFRPSPGQGDAKRGDKLGNNPVPSIVGINPSSVKKGTKNVSITIKGSNFMEKSAVMLSGKPRTAKFVDATELNAQLDDADTATAGTLEITVVNPAPGGGTSKPIQLKVEE
jgi:hypothetical protein